MTVSNKRDAQIPVTASRLQAEHTAAYLNFLSRLPPRRSPAVVPFNENRRAKAKRGNFYFDDDNAPSTSTSSPSTTSTLPLLPPPLARHRGRATLVLDLDHTLVRSVALPPGAPLAKGSEACAGPSGGGATAAAATRTAFARRPHLAAFLARAAELFEVGVFTAGSRAYAEPVLDALDPRRELFAWRLYRDSCVRVPVSSSSTPVSGSSPSSSPFPQPPAAASSVFVVKDLKRLGRPLRRTLLVDNSPTCYAYQVSNGVPVRSWHGGHRRFENGDKNRVGGSGGDGDDSCNNSSSDSDDDDSESGDTALLDLLPLLERAALAPDVRPLIEAAFPAAAAAAAAARAHPSLFACFESDDDDEEEEEEGEEKKGSSSGGAFAGAAAAAKEAAAAAAAAAAADASSDESDATGLAGRRRRSTTTTATGTTEGSNLDLLLAAAASETESESDGDDGETAPVSSPHKKKRGRGERFEEEEERASKAVRLELWQPQAAVCC